MRKSTTPKHPYLAHLHLFGLSALITCLTLFSQPLLAVGIATIGLGTDLTLSSTRLESGTDLVNGDDFADDESGSLQGGIISRTLLANTTQSVITPIKVTSPGTGYTVERGNEALNLILARPDIQVVDYDYLQPASLNLQRQLISSGKTIIIQAGDNSLASPTNQARTVPLLNNGAIIVGGIDDRQLIDNQSNRAGDLKNHFMVAPISSPFSSTKSTAYSRANVSAAAARVYEAAPFLTPQQVVQVLFQSATDLGAPGVDDIYGNGALDVAAALDPVGITNVTTENGGNNNGGGSGGSAFGAIAVAGALGYALFGRSKTLQKTLVLDQFGRGYPVDLVARAPKLGDHSLPQLLQSGSLNQSSMFAHYKPDSDKTTQMNVSLLADNGNVLDLDNSQAAQSALSVSGDTPEVHLSFKSERDFSKGYQTTQLFNLPLNATLGVNAQNQTLQQLNVSSAFSSPYLGFANQSSAFKLAKHNNASSHQFGLSLHDDQGRHGAASRSVVYEGAITNPKSSMGLQIAYTAEQQSLFGSAANGPLGVNAAETLSFTLSGSLQLNEKFELIGSHSIGKTQVHEANHSLLTGFTQLSSQASAIGLLGRNLFTTNDRFAIVASQPLHLNGGQIDINAPTEQLNDGSVLFSNETVNLGQLSAPIQRLSFGYQRPIGKRTQWQSRFIYQSGTYNEQSHHYGFVTRLSINL